MPCVCVMHCRKHFFFRKNDVPGICMPCVCVMHCRRRFFFRKNGVPVISMPCVCVMHCRRRFFFGKNDVLCVFMKKLKSDHPIGKLTRLPTRPDCPITSARGWRPDCNSRPITRLPLPDWARLGVGWPEYHHLNLTPFPDFHF